MRHFRWVLLTTCMAVGGCGGSGSGYARADAHYDAEDPFERAVLTRARVALSCSLVSVQTVGGGGYMARGCRQEQSYTCTTRPASFHREVVCAPDAPPRATTSGASVSSAASVARPPLDATDAQVALDAARGCDEATATLTLTIAAAGNVERVETPDVAPEIATCLVMALRAAHFPAHTAARIGTVQLGATASP